MSMFFGFRGSLRLFWSWMLTPPWRDFTGDIQAYHWAFWLIGWAWAIMGLVGGALVAPSLVQFAGLSHVPYQDELIVGIAVVAGFLVQLVAWCFLAVITASLLRFLPGLARTITNVNFALVSQSVYMPTTVFSRRRVVYFAVLGLVPLAGVGYVLYRYYAWIGVGQRSVTVAFVGALLVKTFLIPLIKGIVTGALFKWFVGWLRGKNTQTTNPA